MIVNKLYFLLIFFLSSGGSVWCQPYVDPHKFGPKPSDIGLRVLPTTQVVFVGPDGGGMKADFIVRMQRRYGMDLNANGVFDMPNSTAYAYNNTNWSSLGCDQKVDGLIRYKVSIDGSNSKLSDASPNMLTSIFGGTVTGRTLQQVPTQRLGVNTPPSVSGSTGVDLGRVEYLWEVNGVSPSTFRYTSSDDDRRKCFATGQLELELPEGEYLITLSLNKYLPSTSSTPTYQSVAKKTFAVRDFLILHLGDSYSSGEGTPDRSRNEGYWGDTGQGIGISQSNQDAHRSSWNWGSVAAALLDQNYSLNGAVSYLNFAAAGNQIRHLTEQIKSAKEVIGNRKVDAVFLSIGGNDVGFYNAIAAYMLRTPIALGQIIGPNQDQIRSSIHSGIWDGHWTSVGGLVAKLVHLGVKDTVPWNRVLGLDQLGNGYNSVADLMKREFGDTCPVFILEYPNPFVASGTESNPTYCGKVMRDCSLPGTGIGTGEQGHATLNLIRPLNRQIRDSSALHGWHTISTENVFFGFPVCGPTRMVNDCPDSQTLQGDITGSMHPNALGHQQLALRAYETVKGHASLFQRP